MAEDWTLAENDLLARAAVDLHARQLAGESVNKAVLYRELGSALPSRNRSSVERKIGNASTVIADLGLGSIDGFRYEAFTARQEALVPAVHRALIEAGMLDPATPTYEAMGVYVGEAAMANLERGLQTRTWGFTRWRTEYRAQPTIRFVVFACGFSGGSPRKKFDEGWSVGTANVIVAKFVGPFLEGTAPHWEDELAEKRVKYPCRFGIEPVASFERVSLAASGPLGRDLSNAIRVTATNSGLGMPLIRANSSLLGQLEVPEDADQPLPPVDMTADLPTVGHRRRRGLGRVSDAALNKAIELRAEDVAEDHYWERGALAVRRVGSHKSWDLEVDLPTASPDGAPHYELRVEVKGTSGAGTHVQLTANEVRNARSHPDCELFVVRDITVSWDDAGNVSATGGEPHLVSNWDPDGADLRPLTFEYRVPSSDS